MTPDISCFLTKDFVYKQNPDNSYIVNNGELVRENMNDVVDAILEILSKIYSNIINLNKVSPGKVECNTYLLNKVLTRHSRDIFGELRLDARLDYLKRVGAITENQKNCLSQYSDYGFKTESRSPYIHRQLANLLYWLSVLKPFAVYTDDISVISPLGVAFEFHNEYISYLLALALLRPFDRTLTIHHKMDLFYDFLYDLHHRNLSRSSLEFFLHAFIKKANTAIS